MNEHPSFFTCNSHIMHSTLTSNKSVEYENLIGEFEASLNKMRTTQKNVDSAIQTEESLLNEINKNYQKDFEELDGNSELNQCRKKKQNVNLIQPQIQTRKIYCKKQSLNKNVTLHSLNKVSFTFFFFVCSDVY